MSETEIDPSVKQDDPQGQLSEGIQGNDQDNGNVSDNSPTDFIEVKGVKIPQSEFESLAREKYKDRFEAYENREKWQKTNTERAAELKDAIRKAEMFDRMMSENRFQQPKPSNPYEAQKQEYIKEMKSEFPEVDERFFAKNFDWNVKLAESKSRELVEPIHAEAGDRFEKEFLAAHPKVVKGSPEYHEIAQLMARGVDAEKAYRTVFMDSILEDQLKERTEKAIKQRDEEALRKLKQSRQSSGANGVQPKSKNLDERAWNIIKKFRGTE